MESLGATGRQVLIAFAPVGLIALLLHLIERSLTARLVSRFGWRGVLITGWLGVPVHELSHAVVAVRLGIAIRSVTLFVFGGDTEMQTEPSSASSATSWWP